MSRSQRCISQILKWADAHYQRTGRWPTSNDGEKVFREQAVVVIGKPCRPASSIGSDSPRVARNRVARSLLGQSLALAPSLRRQGPSFH